jgi:hypothetical protein
VIRVGGAVFGASLLHLLVDINCKFENKLTSP